MKKYINRIFSVALTLTLFSALSISALAGSNSSTVPHDGYNCSCYLSVSKYSASASLSCSGIPGEPAILEPVCNIAGSTYNNRIAVGRLACMGTTSCSTRTSWDGDAATHAECTFYFMGWTVETLIANV